MPAPSCGSQRRGHRMSYREDSMNAYSSSFRVSVEIKWDPRHRSRCPSSASALLAPHLRPPPYRGHAFQENNSKAMTEAQTCLCWSESLPARPWIPSPLFSLCLRSSAPGYSHRPSAGPMSNKNHSFSGVLSEHGSVPQLLPRLCFNHQTARHV